MIVHVLSALVFGAIVLNYVQCAKVGCATTNVKIRSRPLSSSSRIGLLVKHQCLPYRGLSWDRKWAMVAYKGRTSWIYKKYLVVKHRGSCHSGSHRVFDCFGDVMKLRPTGAGSRTAAGLGYLGVRASNALLDQDIEELTKRKQCYITAGANECIHPAIIAAIASRNSRGGKLLYKTRGWGYDGNTWGIMQCNVLTSGLGAQGCQKFGWNSCQHIDQMTKDILVPNIKRVRAKHPNWTPEQQLQGGVSAYNAGVRNVQTWTRLDVGSSGDDYSNDVIARAQRLITRYGW